MLKIPFHFLFFIWTSLGDWSLPEGGESLMNFVLVLGAWEIHSFETSVGSRLGRRQHSLPPLFVADRRSGYVFVLVWFRFGDFGFNFDFCSHWHTGPSV